MDHFNYMHLKQIRTLFFKKKKKRQNTFLMSDIHSAFKFPNCLMNLSLGLVRSNQNPSKMHPLHLVDLSLLSLNMRVPRRQSFVFEDTGSFFGENVPRPRSRDGIPLAPFGTPLFPYVYWKLLGSGAWWESECFVCFVFIHAKRPVVDTAVRRGVRHVWLSLLPCVGWILPWIALWWVWSSL